jgi:two-component system phosphate regulon sensor histidine kinase PhoR
VQDIRWNAFWLALTLVIVSLITWASSDATTALLVFITGLLTYLVSHLFWIYRLNQWLKKPILNQVPHGKGIWEDIFASLYQLHRQHSRNQTQLSSALGRFRHAASALPDGVVVLNSNNEIEWCNKPAEAKLGLNLKKDEQQPISYLIRQNDFINYLQSQDYNEPIKLLAPNAETTLEIQLIPFGTKQKLLICRDVTQKEKIDAMRRDFIANVSHELRTPLTVVGGFVETLLDMEGAVPANMRTYFDMMQEQTNRMRRLIEDLLTLSHIESNAQPPEDSEINMEQLTSMLLSDGYALSKGQHVLTLNAAHNLNLLGAPEELLSALSNLVSNAIRYTPQDGKIEISWQLQPDGSGIFSVADNGIGIEQIHIDRLTERFYRVDRGRSRETGGTGLGLSIVKHILTRHQAKLQISSELGVGSVFSVIFPKVRIVQK